MQLPVTLEIKPSRSLAAALCLAHAAVAVGVLLIGLPSPAALGACGLLAGSLVFALRRQVLRAPFAALTLKGDGTLDVRGRDGMRQSAAVDPRTVVFPWLVTLLLRIGEGRASLALPPDALEGDGHRRLRLWLRWKASAAEA